MKFPQTPVFDHSAAAKAQARQKQLTKPEGAMGQLEELSVRLAGMVGDERPHFYQKGVIVMAGDHGVVAEGVSAYPQDVTPQMVFNFLNGGAAINALARHIGADTDVPAGDRIDLDGRHVPPHEAFLQFSSGTTGA